MAITRLRFRINGLPYRQLLEWQDNIDHAILVHQLQTRGQALVTKSLAERKDSDNSQQDVIKIRDLPQQGEYKPYYASIGAYRYTFQPMVEGCRLEVVNQMAGFAFYLAERSEPLNLYLFQPVEVITSEIDVFTSTAADPEQDACLALHDREASEMVFQIPSALYNKFTNWAWSRRPLHAYHFIFVPAADNHCEARIFARESGMTLVLTDQETL